MPLKRAAAIRHIDFEDLGSFAPVLRARGYTLDYVEAPSADLCRAGLEEADLLVVLGGPIGAYEEAAYPYLADELTILKARIAQDRPTLGICLGAQLMARALGSRVYLSGVKEIGWSPVTLSREGLAGPLRHLDGKKVLHWHADTFDLPDGCGHLASTELCVNQAFARGSNLLAIQFHPEATVAGFERWLVGHAAELAAAGIEPAELRKQADEAGPRLERAAQVMFAEWLDGLAA